MKPKKKAFGALFTLAIIGSLLVSGCPGPDPDPIEPEKVFFIALDPTIEHGKIEVRRSAVPESSVTVKAIPNSGYVVLDIRVRDKNLNHPVEVKGGTNDAWTFVMPAFDVTVSATFETLLTAVEKTVESLVVTSTWDEIAVANALIVRTQESLARSALAIEEERLGAIIEKLAGKYKLDEQGNKIPQYFIEPEPPAGVPIYEMSSIGLIRAKMRNEDLREWIPLTPSFNMAKGATIGTNEDPLGENRSHIYYLKENYPSGLPPITPGAGWKVGDRHHKLWPFYGWGAIHIALEGVTYIPLTYSVGKYDDIVYDLLLWPCAQYTLQYENGATGNVTIEEWRFNKNDYWEPAGPWKQAKQGTLNSGLMQVIGDIGRTDTASMHPGYPSAIYMKFESPEGTTITVTDKNNNVITSLSNLDGALNGTDSKGAFSPESKSYLIKVRKQ